MGNKVKYGLKNVYYSVITETDGVVTYGTPVAIPGGVNLVANPKGEKTEFYADNITYFTATANQGYEGTLEIALVPDSFKKDVLGYVEDSNLVLFEDANAEAKNIALLFEFSGDKNATRHILYNVSVVRANVEGSTKGQSVEVKTETMAITAAPAIDTGYVKSEVTADKAQYDSWFTTVYKYVEGV